MNMRGIADYPNYLFAEDGKVYSLTSRRFLKPLVVPNGYRHVVLCWGGRKRRFSVHRLIAAAFHGAPPFGAVTNHKNGIRDDNRAENLEWVTPSENVSHAYASGLRTINPEHRLRCAALGKARRSYTDDQAARVRIDYTGKRGEITRLAAQYGLSRHAIANILGGCA